MRGASHRRWITVLPTVLLYLAWVRSAAAAEPTSEDDASTKPLAEMTLEELLEVRISPFEVSATLDNGYRASNAVSGSRFDAPITELPFAIQVFTEAFIRDQKPVTLFDVARYSPGVTYRSNDFNEGNANLAIRGFTVSSIGGGNIQVLRDGFHGPSIFDFTNISRVEVVKGPASFLYGQVAPGGIVNIITKSPQPDFAATANLRYGSYGEYRLETDVTGPATRTLFYRLATSYDQDMHYWDPYDARSRNLSPSLLWQPNERVSVSLKYEDFVKLETPQLMQKPGYNRQVGVVPTSADPNRSGVDVPGLPDSWNSMSTTDYRRSETRGFSTWVDFEADTHWNLRAGYSRQRYVVDAVASGNFGMANNATFVQGRRVRGQTYTNRDDSVEAQALGNYDLGGVSLRALLGAQHVVRGFDTRAAQAPNDPALGSDPIASPLQPWDLRDPSTWDRAATVAPSAFTENASKRSTLALDTSLFAGTTFGFFDERLLVLAGARWTTTTSRLTDELTSQAQPRITSTATTPQYGVLYKFLPGLAGFGSYSESFVPGTALLQNLDGTTSRPRPTRGRGYDLGLKTDLLDGRISGTFTYFDIRNRDIVNDLATTDSTGTVTIYNVQSGEQRSRGVEFDSVLTPVDEWQLYLSYSYMDARITEFSGHDAAILARDPATLDAAGQANYKTVNLLHDAHLQMSAPHLANLWTRYSFTQRDLAGAYLGGGFNLVYDQTLLPDGPPSSHQTYLLLNASVGYSWGRIYRQTLELAGKNLSDQHYRPSQSTRSRPRELLLAWSIGL